MLCVMSDHLGCYPFLEQLVRFVKKSKPFSQSNIASNIAALILTPSVNEPLICRWRRLTGRMKTPGTARGAFTSARSPTTWWRTGWTSSSTCRCGTEGPGPPRPSSRRATAPAAWPSTTRCRSSPTLSAQNSSLRYGKTYYYYRTPLLLALVSHYENNGILFLSCIFFLFLFKWNQHCSHKY